MRALRTPHVPAAVRGSLPPLDIGNWGVPAAQRHASDHLSLRVLRTAADRATVADLRKLAAFGVERDLGLDLAHLESLRDELGLVGAIYRGQRVIATIRTVPTGHGLTAAERLDARLIANRELLGPDSWEVGRLIMAPEERHADLLPQCLALAVNKLRELRDVEHLHSTTTLLMARLYRRFGMATEATTEGRSGTPYALISGRAADVAAALNKARPEPARPAREALLC